MSIRQFSNQRTKAHASRIAAALAAVWSLCFGVTLHAATAFDAGGGTHWWYNPLNWSVDRIPPNNADGTATTDAQINLGETFAGSMGEGVVYDPANDPGFAAAQPPGTTYPTGFGPKNIAQLYISRDTLLDNLLTLKGDLNVTTAIIGRSSSQDNVATNGRVNQLAGVFESTGNVDLGQSDTSNRGFGNGIWDYRGGTFIANRQGGTTGLRFSGGSTTTNSDSGLPTGPGGRGRFIVHNPTTPGFIRVGTLNMGTFRGDNNAETTAVDPNGDTSGVGTLEFHYENGGVRPIQSVGNLTLNNGFHEDSGGTTSARLDLQLDSAVTLQAGNIPVNLGLVDVDFDDPDYPNDDFVTGIVAGSGTLGGTFSSAEGATNLPEGAMVSAVFGSTKYNWTISYHGIITWTDINAGSVASVTAGVGDVDSDVVLLGHSIEVVANDADFDNDSDVDGNDFLIWQRGQGTTTGATNGNGDANGNGAVDGADLGIWKTQFGMTGSAASVSAVPEPASFALSLLVLLLGNRGRRARHR
jgi:hypothetical protein